MCYRKRPILHLHDSVRRLCKPAMNSLYPSNHRCMQSTKNKHWYSLPKISLSWWSGRPLEHLAASNNTSCPNSYRYLQPKINPLMRFRIVLQAKTILITLPTTDADQQKLCVLEHVAPEPYFVIPNHDHEFEKNVKNIFSFVCFHWPHLASTQDKKCWCCLLLMIT